MILHKYDESSDGRARTRVVFRALPGRILAEYEFKQSRKPFTQVHSGNAKAPIIDRIEYAKVSCKGYQCTYVWT